MRAAFTLAREATERGDRPFGAVLVQDDTVVMRDSNRVNTENDIRRHPELHLAYRSCRELSPEERSKTVMYTTTEPCAMCARGMRDAGFNRVIYSVSSEELQDFMQPEPGNTESILNGETEVLGPVLNEEGRQLHEKFEY